MQESKSYSQITGSFLKRKDGDEQQQQIINIDGLIQIKTGDFIDIANTKAKQFYSLLIELNIISHPSVLFYWQEVLNVSPEYMIGVYCSK